MTYDEVLFEASTLELQSSVVREKSMVVDLLFGSNGSAPDKVHAQILLKEHVSIC